MEHYLQDCQPPDWSESPVPCLWHRCPQFHNISDVPLWQVHLCRSFYSLLLEHQQLLRALLLREIHHSALRAKGDDISRARRSSSPEVIYLRPALFLAELHVSASCQVQLDNDLVHSTALVSADHRFHVQSLGPLVIIPSANTDVPQVVLEAPPTSLADIERHLILDDIRFLFVTQQPLLFRNCL